MKITVFSSNQARHLNLVKRLSSLADRIFFISECNTVFPGVVSDTFKKSEVMQTYFSNVISAEKKIFGDINFLPNNVSTLSIKSGDLNLLTKQQIVSALNADIYIVFGASYIKGWLIDFLVSNNAINIHMGLSPYYRGSSCNFWALYDENPSYVGATIHKLSKGLDSGPMLFHCIPQLKKDDRPFDYTMRAVEVAHEGLYKSIKDGSLLTMGEVLQDKSLEVRYSRGNEFSDNVASEFMARNLDLQSVDFDYPHLVRPLFG
jgi:folate-dependent phosphoribosylglycinamide formyltransferase PurN